MDTAYFQQKLLQQQAELLAQGATGKENAQPVVLDQATVGRLSRMDALQGQQMALEVERRRKILLQKIEAALKRIAADEYGLCLECGETINPRRLDAEPTSIFCIHCAKAKD